MSQSRGVHASLFLDDIFPLVGGSLAIFLIYILCQTLKKRIPEKEALLRQFHEEVKAQAQHDEERSDMSEAE